MGSSPFKLLAAAAISCRRCRGRAHRELSTRAPDS